MTFHKGNCDNVVEALTEEDQRLNLTFENLDHIPPVLLNSFTSSIKILDLSHNCFSDLSFLSQFPNLKCLILDHNRVNSSTTFPTVPDLKVLWLNHNHIDRLFPFVQRLQDAFPHLEQLSLMANEAVPINIDDSTFYQHLQYRLFVISWFSCLSHLDDEPVREDERQEAHRLYKRPLLERLISHKSLNALITRVNSAFSLIRSRNLSSKLKPAFV
ncbi:leucine-rich melanocyte differentiation-associated protein-like [Macrosteles quadrilineatus]|uniref:leucine-rich melanocyte differentiation-associated protein-like n=1 Tax=Macrosteles quadrilineatus TaxID=74068 RepID=UPI0023E2C7BD|nr:leucine-rich melanocyte differentiation-associated protein-like [Macrosteles quadrilineatus]